MATAAPHVKLLRQLASAKDDYLSGAFDISWDGAKATLYLVFGRPSHAVFETDQTQIEGEAAIDALLAALPRVFAVSDWRRAMSPHETLSITIDELAGPFVRLAGSYADDPVTEESPEWWSAVDDSPDLPFGLADFPLLPGGRPLWLEASPEEVHLADRLAELPPSILMLTGAKLRAAAVVSGGDLIDAVWIDADDHARGETAGMAILGATKGSLAGYALDDPRVAEALTMLWRLPLAVSGVELSWLDPASMLAAFRADGLDRVLVIDAPVRGIALFSRGGLVAVYSETQRSAVASPERLRSLLSQARGRLTVMERKPRPLAADATAAPASARDFFEVTAPDAATDEPAVAEPVGFDTGETDHEAGAALAPESTETEPDEAVATELAPPPPPPPDEEVAAVAGEMPPPPPPAATEAQPEPKPKRSRWGFGRSRKSRKDRHAAEEAAAAIVDESVQSADSEAATFAGWSIRQPNADAQPVWHRSQDPSDPPPPAADVEPGESDEAAAPTWSLAHSRDDAATTADETVAGDIPLADAAPPASDALIVADVNPPTEPADAAPDSTTDDADHEAATESASESWLSASWLDDVVHGDTPQPATEPGVPPESEVSEHTGDGAAPDMAFIEAAGHSADMPIDEPDHEAEASPDDETASVAAAADDELDSEGGAPTPGHALRTPGPWSWPLAEPDEEPLATSEAGASTSQPSDEPDALELQPVAVPAFAHEDDAAASEHDAEFGILSPRRADRLAIRGLRRGAQRAGADRHRLARRDQCGAGDRAAQQHPINHRRLRRDHRHHSRAPSRRPGPRVNSGYGTRDAPAGCRAVVRGMTR